MACTSEGPGDWDWDTSNYPPKIPFTALCIFFLCVISATDCRFEGAHTHFKVSNVTSHHIPRAYDILLFRQWRRWRTGHIQMQVADEVSMASGAVNDCSWDMQVLPWR